MPYVLLATLFWSGVGLLFDLFGSEYYPFLFSGFFRLGAGIGTLPGLLGSGLWRVMLVGPVRRLFLGMLCSWLMVVCVLSRFETVLFGVALGLGAAPVVWVVFNIWPVLLVVLMYFFFRSRGRYDSSFGSLWPVLLLALLGFLVSGPARSLLQVSGGGLPMVLGSLVALLCAVCAGLGTSSLLRLGDVFGERALALRGRVGVGLFPEGVVLSPLSAYVLGANLFHCSIQFLNASMVLPVGFALGERFVPGCLVMAFLGGFLISGVADLYFRRGNAVTRNISVNGLVYACPVLGLLWFWLFSDSGEFRWVELLLGATLVSLAGLLASRRSV